MSADMQGMVSSHPCQLRSVVSLCATLRVHDGPRTSCSSSTVVAINSNCMDSDTARPTQVFSLSLSDAFYINRELVLTIFLADFAWIL